MVYNVEKFHDAVKKEAAAQVEAAMEKIIADAKSEIEVKLRAHVAQIVLQMENYYSVMHRGENLVITVENKR